MKELYEIFDKVGDPVTNTEEEFEKIKEFYNEKAKDNPRNKFYMYVDVRPSEEKHLKWVSDNVTDFLGTKMINTENWLDFIHPNYRYFYFTYARTVYKFIKNNPQFAQIDKDYAPTYVIQIPLKIKEADRSFVYKVVTQQGFAIQFDSNGMMVGHMQEYLVGDYYDEETIFWRKPFFQFDFSANQKKNLAEEKFIEAIKIEFIDELYNQLDKNTRNDVVKDTLLAYWREYSKAKRPDSKLDLKQINAKHIASILDVTYHTVQKHHVKIIDAANEIFAFANCRKISDVIEILYKLFGTIEKPLDT